MNTEDFITWRVRIESAKANNELERITRKRRVKRREPIVFVIGLDELERGDISRVVAEFGRDSDPAKLRDMIGNVTFAFAGLNRIHEEVFEFQPVRHFVRELNLHFPLWSTFCEFDSGVFRTLTACISERLFAKRELQRQTYDLAIPRAEVMKVFINSVPLTSAFHKLAELPVEAGRKRLTLVAKHLGLL